MVRLLPILVGLVVLVAGGVVHGLWTDRWERSEAVAQAAERLAKLPNDVGPWKGTAHELEDDMLEMSGASGNYSRRFVDPVTGEQVLVILLVGKPTRMSIHRPEHCYQSAGYDMNSTTTRVQVKIADNEEADFFTALFSREEATGLHHLRIFWSFFANGRWSAPANPRFSFAREKVLYKLYVLRQDTGQTKVKTDDPCIRLMTDLMPILERTLAFEE
jgi:hypothetical protein